MRLSPALVAGFAVATSAFLIPPEIPEGFKDARFRGGPPEHFKEFIHAILEEKTTTIHLACPECPFAASQATGPDGTPNAAIQWEPKIDSVIHLEFDTHGHTFNLNGHPLLPFDKAQQAQSQPIKAFTIRKDTHEQSVEVQISFAMEVMPPIASPHNDGVSLIPVEFTVLGLNGIPVKANSVSLKLVQPPNNDFVIVHAEEVPFKETPGAEQCEGARLWSLCRLRAIIVARIKYMAEAAKGKSGNVHGWVKEKIKGCDKGQHPHPPYGVGEHPHPHHHWRGHHRHHRHHRLGHMLHQTFRFFVIPALLGIIGGLAASAIGMLVGQLIVLIWFKAYRSSRRGPLRLEREIVVVEDERDELLGEQEVPPAYEDAPKYEDAVSRDVEAEPVPRDEEKH